MRTYSLIIAIGALILLIANIYFIIGDVANGESFSGHVAGAISMLLFLIAINISSRKRRIDKENEKEID